MRHLGRRALRRQLRVGPVRLVGRRIYAVVIGMYIHHAVLNGNRLAFQPLVAIGNVNAAAGYQQSPLRMKAVISGGYAEGTFGYGDITV